MPRAEIKLGDGDVIEVRLEGDAVVLSTSRWQQSLSREEAWDLMEAIEAISTRTHEDGR